MSQMVIELYDGLRKVGLDEESAKAAARNVLGADQRTDLATKADISELRLAMRADLSDLRAELIKWNLGAIAVLTAIFSAIVKLT